MSNYDPLHYGLGENPPPKINDDLIRRAKLGDRDAIMGVIRAFAGDIVHYAGIEYTFDSYGHIVPIVNMENAARLENRLLEAIASIDVEEVIDRAKQLVAYERKHKSKRGKRKFGRG